VLFALRRLVAGHEKFSSLFIRCDRYELKSYTAKEPEAEVGKPEEPYIRVIVETYYESGSGLHGDIHVRPVAGQQVSRSLRVRFPKALRARASRGNTISGVREAH
jgi:hypothetical protein